MSLELFSTVLTVGSMAVSGVLVVSLVLFQVSAKFREHVRAHSYWRFLTAMGILSVVSIAGALIYQLVYLTPVCELCWWQRIFFFPISVIALIAVWHKSKEAHITIAVLAALGLFYASYHYYYHFQGLVLGNKLALPCSSGGLLPACTDSPILIFGFVTIPFMGILMFLSMLILAYFAQKVLKPTS
ncbi:hypothetical protein BH11PAT2_BH11PAT2_04650 [soil metagenome]